MISPVREPAEVGLNLPFRWDLIAPDRLGSLLAGTAEPDLWFLDALAECAGKVVARSGGGDLFFVGRSLDSVFDLLSGALAESGPGVYRLPFSFARPVLQSGRRWRARPLSAAEREQARGVLAGLGLAPAVLARRARPAAFADVVSHGSTFTELFLLLRDWADEDRGQWDVIRRKLRFTGVTARRKTSPNTFRWQQHAAWAGQLPAGAIRNVSVAGLVWGYLANSQVKLTSSFKPDQWLAEAGGPQRDPAIRQALAEAVAITTYGRSVQGRKRIARAISHEPALSQPWLRDVVRQLNQSGTRQRQPPPGAPAPPEPRNRA